MWVENKEKRAAKEQIEQQIFDITNHIFTVSNDIGNAISNISYAVGDSSLNVDRKLIACYSRALVHLSEISSKLHQASADAEKLYIKEWVEDDE